MEHPLEFERRYAAPQERLETGILANVERA